jgi:hypothetical protein
MEAQRYPPDYDGIVAGARAINWNRLHPQQLWDPVLMNTAGNPIAACKLEAATIAAIAVCDAIDGVRDGVIEDLKRCQYDPKPLIGTSAGDCGVFTETDVDLIRELWGARAAKTGASCGTVWLGEQTCVRSGVAGNSSQTATVRHHVGLVPLLSGAESSARLDYHHTRSLRAFLGSIGGGVMRT